VGVVDTSKWSQSTSPNGSISNIMQNGSLGVGLVSNGFNQGIMNKIQLNSNGVNSTTASQQPDWQLNSNIFTNRVYFKNKLFFVFACVYC